MILQSLFGISEPYILNGTDLTTKSLENFKRSIKKID